MDRKTGEKAPMHHCVPLGTQCQKMRTDAGRNLHVTFDGPQVFSEEKVKCAKVLVSHHVSSFVPLSSPERQGLHPTII